MISLIGIPYDDASSFLKGPAAAPDAIRHAMHESSHNLYSESGIEIKEGVAYKDLGNIHFHQEDPDAVFRTIRDRIDSILDESGKVLSIGGDHSITYPIVDAYRMKYQDLHILHFDAHADLYDEYDRNPYSHACPFARIMESGGIASLIQVGIRTLEPHQVQQAKRFNVQQVEMRYFSMDFLDTLKGPLYVSIDMDALDPAFAPGVSHFEPGGLSVRQLITMIRQIHVPIIGADIVEYNPTRDINHMTAHVGFKIFKEVVAKMLE